MINKILIPSDGSAHSERAVEKGIELAKATGASIVAFTVTEPYPVRKYGDLIMEGIAPLKTYGEQVQQAAKRVLAAVEQRVKAAGLRFEGYMASSESPAEAIVEAADKHGCDLICMASHGRKGPASVLLGSETTKVLTHAKISVFVCR